MFSNILCYYLYNFFVKTNITLRFPLLAYSENLLWRAYCNPARLVSYNLLSQKHFCSYEYSEHSIKIPQRISIVNGQSTFTL